MPCHRCRVGLAVLLGLVLALSPRPARAQVDEEPAIIEVTIEDDHGHEHEKKIRLDDTKEFNELVVLLRKGKVIHIARAEPKNIFEVRWELGLWTVVVFALLYFILRKTAWKPMLEGLQRREENIQGALNEAQKAREEAKALRESLQQQLDKASDKVRDMLDAARRDAQKATDDMIAKARTEIGTERERLHHELQVAKDAALRELWSQTAQLATLVSAKTLRRQLTTEDHRQLVDEALNQMRGAATQLRKEVWDKI